MNRSRFFGFCALSSVICCLVIGCTKPLATGRITTTEPVTRVMPSDPNTIYYGIKWAMEQMGYPEGSEDLAGGVVESKWVPTGAGSHYVNLFDGRDYGANAMYYKMVVRIVPVDVSSSKVEAYTEVNSIVDKVETTGQKERAMLDKIAEHIRGYSVTVTNLGVEE